MKTTLRVAAVTIGLMILVGCSHLFVAGQIDQRNPGSIDGVWQTVVTPRNCNTGDPLGLTFPGILMFNHDGTITGTSTAVTSTYGIWHREAGAGQYSFTSLSLKYNTSGVFVGSRRITQNVTVDENRNRFTSDGGFQDLDAAGTQIASGCSTSTGSRFQ